METANLVDAERAFADAFGAFQTYAFRLEWRQIYDVEEERELFRSFLKDGAAKSCPHEFVDGCKEIAQARADGKLYQRVRRVTVPLSDYTRFEILNGYRFCVEAGEQVRILENADSNSDFARSVGDISDFWLFDDKLCFELEYNAQGQFVAAHKMEENRLPFYVAAKSKLWGMSVELGKSNAWKLAWTQQIP